MPFVATLVTSPLITPILLELLPMLLLLGLILLLLLLWVWSSTVFRQVTHLVTPLTCSVTRAIVVVVALATLRLFTRIRARSLTVVLILVN
ncbi:hypothetical protein HanIR_Chr14g0716201 [Helianthus annuus]|nr:hypothetical protein HanIR_Chr14g0716201 [Helianthus annuus]